MKKYWPIGLAIIIGIIFGNLIFDSYETETVMSSDGSVYMLQYGAYTSKEVMNENIKNLDSSLYVISFIDDVYYVYFGLTTNYYNALNIVKIYKNRDIYLYIKENYLGKNSVISEIKRLDSLMKDETNNEIVLSYVKDGLNIYRDNYKN